MSEPLPAAAVQKVAHLSRLKLSDDEVARFGQQLGDVLKYVELLNTVDTTGIEPMAHPVETTNVLRADEERPSLPRADALANAPKADGRYFLVPQILENG
jgi:aspartyl-tRNA(Asn)/glutamyl-tRNA(Gln) amidotransferase subunit C